MSDSDSSDNCDSISVDLNEWSDVSPINQDRETNDICRIAYTEKFNNVFGYFRAVLKTNEISERAFDLTYKAVMLNPANYTVWYYRRILLKELGKDLNQELKLITKIIDQNPKNYQVWQHRRNVVELLQDPSRELEFTENILEQDSKNYHAWQYRQWVTKAFSLWHQELDFTSKLITVDCKNNSAWNHRFFYLKNTDHSESVLNREIDYCFEKLNLNINNESVWNYLRGVVDLMVKEGYLYPEKVCDFCKLKLETTKEDELSPFLIAFKIDYNWAKAIEKKNSGTNEIKEYVQESIRYLDLLAQKYDTIRANYWKYLLSKWNQEFNQ
ncbi:farnesyltransferase geranylgeranyltransferase type-1 subunit alpha [Brachionus plicatilis]|uniref:Protein farnesyltransferase/geranylgeranyltransferase type-1 subunit alpha n=1 Tax=Brachionus plicatilis TaxID=10195 RepID=A0A3M7R0K0_BRAPC|nr:farnesyltransferase geranylgeranyltransferase type-1 subunit alpha [Brachionus plicatilis]